MANLTPPVALAAFPRAGIAGSDPQRTGWISCELALQVLLFHSFLFIWSNSYIYFVEFPIFSIDFTLFDVLDYILSPMSDKKYRSKSC